MNCKSYHSHWHCDILQYLCLYSGLFFSFFFFCMLFRPNQDISLVIIYFSDLPSGLNPCNIVSKLACWHRLLQTSSKCALFWRSPSAEYFKPRSAISLFQSCVGGHTLRKHRAGQHFDREGLTHTTRHAQSLPHQSKEQRSSDYNVYEGSVTSFCAQDAIA